jgi:hypothetical protein
MLSKRLQGTVGYARPFGLAAAHPGFFLSAIRIIAEATRSFFVPQFENALLHRRPVVNVDHPLDATIPFDPSFIKKYLEFVQLWMASFYRLRRFYGPKREAEILGFLEAIRRLYAEAGSVYGVVHTTTTRPSKNYNLRFAIIHAVDPHLNCVPSLHVILVVANWLLASRIVARLGADGARGYKAEQVELWAASLRVEALAITESVLFVKQHSVNCVGASLYYLKRRFPAFGDEAARAFVRDLFASDAARLGNADELRRVMLEVCASLDGAYALSPEKGWRPPIMDFIGGFAIQSRL